MAAWRTVVPEEEVGGVGLAKTLLLQAVMTSLAICFE